MPYLIKAKPGCAPCERLADDEGKRRKACGGKERC